jgi:hypothetical protein
MNETTPDQASVREPAPDQLRLLGELLGFLDAAGYDPRDTQQLRLILAARLRPQAGRPIPRPVPRPGQGDQALPAAPPDEALLERLDTAALIARSSLGTPSARRIRGLTSASQIAEILRRRDQLAAFRQQPPAGPGTTWIPQTGPAAAGSAGDFRTAADTPPTGLPPVSGGPAQARRHRPFRRSWLTAAVAAAAVMLAAFVSATFITAGHQVNTAAIATPAAPSQSPAPHATSPAVAGKVSVSPAVPASGVAAMAAIGSYLARNASVPLTVRRAIDGVENCTVSPSSGQATLQQVINTRQGILNDLRTLPVSGLPDGAQLVSTLTTAMQDSVNQDRHYHSWMVNFANAESPCGSDPGQDPYYAAAQNLSARTTVAKNAFLVIWNPVAPGYGQHTYSPSEL